MSPIFREKFLLKKCKTTALCHDSDDALLNMTNKHRRVIATDKKKTTGEDLDALIHWIAHDPKWKNENWKGERWDNPKDNEEYKVPL
jgi:hypothetical protein